MSTRRHLFSVTKDDCEWDYSNGVKCTHAASGAVGESKSEETDIENGKSAFRKMIAKDEFRSWVQKESKRLSGVDATLRAGTEIEERRSNPNE